MSILGIALTVSAAMLFTVVVLGAWIDGGRQALRKKGLHPVTTPEGHVVAREHEHDTANGEWPEHYQG